MPKYNILLPTKLINSQILPANINFTYKFYIKIDGIFICY